MSLNDLVDSFLPESKNYGTERVNIVGCLLLRFNYELYTNCNETKTQLNGMFYRSRNPMCYHQIYSRNLTLNKIAVTVHG